MILPLFLLGCWQAQLADPTTSLVENYRQASPGLIQGISRTVQSGRTLSVEYIEIEESDGDVKLTSSFSDEDSSQYLLFRQEPGLAVFHNVSSDLPRWMAYERQGESTLVLSLYGADTLASPSHSIVFRSCD